MTTRREQAIAVFFSVLMVVSMIGGTVAFGGVAAADGAAGIDTADMNTDSEGLFSTENGTESTTTSESDSGDSQESSPSGDGESGEFDATSADSTEDRSSISPRVRLRLDQSSASERIPVILLFRTQPEDQLPLDQMTAAEAHDDIKTLAEDSQGPTLQYLDEQAQRGKAADIQPLYLRNAIAVEANPEVIEELASARAIERVILDEQVSVLDGSNSGNGLDEFLSELNETGNETVDPTGFERVVEGERARGVEEIQADSVQDAGVTGAGVNVSVIDTGINDSHPALDGQVVLRKNFVDNETDVGDPQGHGTHVAGTVAGQTDAQQTVGVAPDANLFDARALDDTGGGQLSDIISAFEWSAENDADVASASLGLDPYGDVRDERVQIDNESTENVTFEVHSDATNSTEENTSALDGFRPSYVYVRVDNAEIENSSSVVDDETAVENLSLTLRDPNGEETLEPNDSGFAYPSGTVPDGVLLYKYTPSSSQPVADGNWTLTVSNGNSDTGVDVDVETVPVYPPDGTDEVSQAVNNLESTGTIPVIAAGNAGVLGNRTLASPAAAENAITVGSTEPESIDVAPFSSRGPVDFGADTRPGVDLVAPGVDIVSAASPQVQAGEEPYASYTGTSMATPHVSGTVALLFDADPTLARSDVETALKSTAQSPPLGENAVGAGALDAYAAADSVTDEPLTADQSVDSGIELYAGIGNTSDTNVYASAQPVTDPVGDAGSAPDLEAAAVRANFGSADFRLGLADDAAPNATFVTYIDADQNDSTGDAEQSGADYRLELNRTYDGETYDGSLDSFAFNESSQEYEEVDLSASASTWDFENRPQFVRYDVRTDDSGINTSDFDWHVISKDPDSTSTDRLPDAGQADTKFDTNIDGIGVAWNSSAGEPAADTPLQFRLYNESGVLVENRTVRTDADGIAQTTFTDVSEVYSDYTLEIESERGNAVRQEYSLSAPNIDRGPYTGPEPTDESEYTVVNRNYDIRPDDQIELNIPVYSVDNGSINPYEGPASIQFSGGPTINDTTITDGTLTRTVNYTDLFEDETASYTSYRIALATNYTEATETYYAGSINVESEVEFQSSVAPETQVTPPRTETSVSFQTIAERRGTGGTSSWNQIQTPADINSTYEVTWITDRVVASFYDELPDSAAIALDEARRTGEHADSLTAADRKAIDTAIENISTQGIVPRTVTGSATPETRGIGQFDVTPPEDARLGIVTVTPEATEIENETVTNRSGESVIFVDQRIDEFLRTPTAPEQEDRYEVDVRGYWESYENEDGVVVPNESIVVDVHVRDQIDDEPVSDTDVVLYTTGGDTVTVTTGSDGHVETTIPAPDLDYQNVDHEFTNQHILGIAQGLQTSTGRSVSDIETVYGSVYDPDGDQESDDGESDAGVFAQPALSYNETTEQLKLDVEYRNSTTYELTNATTSLTMLGTPHGRYITQRDVFTGYLGTDTDATTVTEEFDESVPGDQPRQYGVRTQTANALHGFDNLYLNGIDAEIDAPGEIEAGDAGDVSVTLTNRTGEPVADASVVLYYTELNSQGTVTAAGDALIGTTDADGAATFTISPDLADEFDQGDIRFRAGYATDNVANPSAGYGYTRIVSDTGVPEANITGSVEYRNGTTAANSTVVAVGGDDEDLIVRETRTDDAGEFEVSVPEGNEYAVAFVQDEPITDDVPDLYTLASTGVIENNTDVGHHTLPAGNETTVQVVDEEDNPVSEALVLFTSHGTQSFDSRGVPGGLLTNEQGQLNVTGNAVELADNVTIEVAPPENSTRFISDLDQYTRQISVTEDTSVNVTLIADSDDGSDGGDDGEGGGDEQDPVVDAQINASSTAVTIDETVTFDASDSTGDNLTYEWEFGDGTNATGETVTHEYDSLGTYNVSLTVTDGDGNQATDELEILVTEELTAVIEPERTTATVGDLIEFDGGNSTGNIQEYQWDFGDGETVTTNESINAHEYTSPGTYTVALTVVDESGETATATVDVTIESETDDDTPGFGPVAGIIALLAAVLVARVRGDT